MKKILLILLVILCMSSEFLSAQNCPECAIALIQNATDVFESKTNKKLDEATNVLYSQDYSFWSSYQTNTNHTTSLDASYALFAASYGSSTSTAEAQQKFESSRTNYSKNHSLSQEEQVYVLSKVASKVAYDAWTLCIQECYKVGGVFLKREGNNDDEFIVTLKNIAVGGPGTETSVTSIALQNCTYVNGDLKEGANLPVWNTLQAVYKRDNREKNVAISVAVAKLAAPSPILIPKYMTSDKIPTPLIPSIVPVGTVVAYAGNNIPSGWLLCDGSVVNQSQYEALSNVIGTFWGNGDHSFGSFNLPDMRGMFLRGVDGGKNDPDVSSRISINGGNSTGVGSKQEDAFQGHYHDVDSYVHDSGQPGPIKSWAQPGVYDSKLTFYNHTNCTATNIIKDDSNVTPRVAKETRPKNVYVYYIIKY